MTHKKPSGLHQRLLTLLTGKYRHASRVEKETPKVRGKSRGATPTGRDKESADPRVQAKGMDDKKNLILRILDMEWQMFSPLDKRFRLYVTSELETYSDRTLDLYYRAVLAARQARRNLVEERYRNTFSALRSNDPNGMKRKTSGRRAA